MLEWKSSEEVRKVHEELYMPSDPEDPSSDTFITLIIKTVFTLETEQTNENAIWAQSVLEAIFDESHLSIKIDVNIVELWCRMLTDTNLVNIMILEF